MLLIKGAVHRAHPSQQNQIAASHALRCSVCALVGERNRTPAVVGNLPPSQPGEKGIDIAAALGEPSLGSDSALPFGPSIQTTPPAAHCRGHFPPRYQLFLLLDHVDSGWASWTSRRRYGWKYGAEREITRTEVAARRKCQSRDCATTRLWLQIIVEACLKRVRETKPPGARYPQPDRTTEQATDGRAPMRMSRSPPQGLTHCTRKVP